MITSAIYFVIKLGLLQLYPTYISYKAIKVNDQKEFQSLLTFWIVSITYLSIEYFSDIFLFWVPFYTEVKLIIVLWLILPQTQGTSVFYTNYLDPFLHNHEQEIDKTLIDIQAKLKETIVLYGKRLVEFLKKSISDVLFKGHETETVDQSQIEPQASSSSVLNSTGGYLISPYNLFSSLVTATASRIQQQQQPQQQPQKEQVESQTNSNDTKNDTNRDVTPSNEKLDRTDSQESLQSYVNIKENGSPVVASRSNATWGEYLSSWVRKPDVVEQDNKKND